MKCEKCGSLLSGTEKFCNGCGTPLSALNSGNSMTNGNVTSEPVVNDASSVSNNAVASNQSETLPSSSANVSPSQPVNISNPFLGERKANPEANKIENSNTNNGYVNFSSQSESINQPEVVNEKVETPLNVSSDKNASLNNGTNTNLNTEAVTSNSIPSATTNNNLNPNLNQNLNNTNYNPNVTPANGIPPKKSSAKPIIFIILGIVFAASSFFVGYYFASNNNDDKKEEDKPSEEITPITTSNANTIYFGGKKLTIPQEYDYDMDNKYLYLKNDEWYFEGQIVARTYSNVVKYKDTVKKNFESKGYKVTGVKEVSYDNTNYLVYTVVNNNSKILAIYSMFDSTHVWCIALTNHSGTNVNINWVKDISKILTSAKNKEIDKNLPTVDLETSLSDISSVLEK